ncbi:Uncharacterized protein Fot_31399 [Forsythia ovata]|uniref:Uncharacterized protein n=1 Tax=Forsythia ovata TaxID=205694 RepID=A0ABD1T4Z7_9LAMI
MAVVVLDLYYDQRALNFDLAKQTDQIPLQKSQLPFSASTLAYAGLNKIQELFSYNLVSELGWLLKQFIGLELKAAPTKDGGLPVASGRRPAATDNYFSDNSAFVGQSGFELALNIDKPSNLTLAHTRLA